MQNFAIVLAAGLSSRMGTCKASLPWLGGKTLLAYQLEQWLLAGIRPIVVLGPHNDNQQRDCPPDCVVAINPNPSAGKTSSILTGLHYTPQNWHVLAISAVDQPRPTKIYQSLLREHRNSSSPITAPTYQGRLGHPILFSSELQTRLESLREETLGLRQLIREFHSVILQVECNTSDVLIDLNTPDSYQFQLQALDKKTDNLL